MKDLAADARDGPPAQAAASIPLSALDPDLERNDEASDAEDQPFLEHDQAAPKTHEEDDDEEDGNVAKDWRPPPYFVLIQTAIFANVFLAGFDGTVTASTYAVISSDFNATNTASWLTTSYLVSSTAFQPLYGRLSDVFGRRACFFISTVAFALGCLGCGLAGDVVLLDCMRALTGVGGGGLITMATVINSDMIPLERRGMYHAVQNGFVGFGAICGASLGGTIADRIGWRWCFILQVPVSLFAFVVGYFAIKDPDRQGSGTNTISTLWRKVDVSGSLLLIAAVSLQLVGLSLGGNDLPWTSPWIALSLGGSVALLAAFFVVEARTSAMPVVPLRLLRGTLPVSTQIANVCCGAAAFGYLFMLPLFFQVVLLDSATAAGARLAIPAFANPVGGVITGAVMTRWGRLIPLVRAGALLMALGSGLVASFRFEEPAWKYFVYIVPANFGQGVVFPALLFTSLATFDHGDHAVTASAVYLIRSLGTVWGVSITSAIVQTTLTSQLPAALAGTPHKLEIIDAVRHSVDAIRDLPEEAQLLVRYVYYDGIRYAFMACTLSAVVALCSSMFSRESGLRRTKR